MINDTVIERLVEISDALGEPAAGRMRDALSIGVPRNGAREETIQYFGENFQAICAVCRPVFVALDGMVPNFRNWMETTGFGDDRDFLLAIYAMANQLAKLKRPSDARMRPDNIPPPRFL
jgi:hypothetical protein